MSGLKVLSEEEKQELLLDARDTDRGRAFIAARRKSRQGGLDDYIDFLSENVTLVPGRPRRHVTDDYRL